MKYKIIKNKHGSYIVKIKPFIIWRNIKKYATGHPLMNDRRYYSVYNSEHDAKVALKEFYEEYLKICDMKDVVIETGNIKEQVFIDSL